VNANVYRLVTLASIRETWYPLYMYMMYIIVAPYFIGELVPVSVLAQHDGSKYGSFYLYGMYLQGNWILLLDTWVFGLLELLYIVAPLTLYLSFCITPASQLYAARKPEDYEEEKKANGDIFYFPPLHDRRFYPIHRRIAVRLAVAAVVLYQVVNVFLMAYDDTHA
jgi:hypothetical protein